MQKVLLIIDLQNDFISGSLAIDKAESIVKPIINLSKKYDFILASKDCHPIDHKSFNNFGGQWPVHCIKNTWGSDFPNIVIENINFDLVILKGQNKNYESYSAFLDEKGNKSSLETFLKNNNIKFVDIVGLALDYCIYYTAIDLIKHNFHINILSEYCRFINKEDWQIKYKKLKNKGVFFK